MLDVPTGAAANEIRQMLDEKIRTKGSSLYIYKPNNIQVAVEGKNDAFYLINIIKCIESNMVNHMESDHAIEDITECDERLRSVLRSECTNLSNELVEVKKYIQIYKNLVQEQCCELKKALDNNEELQWSLYKERQKSKRYWKQRCDLMLTHEDALDEKDATTAALQKQIQFSLVTSSSTPHQGLPCT